VAGAYVLELPYPYLTSLGVALAGYGLLALPVRVRRGAPAADAAPGD
jgi:hypothetical protein